MLTNYGSYWAEYFLTRHNTLFAPSSETQGQSVGGGRNGATKVFKNERKNPWVPSLTGPFPNGFANTGSWLGRIIQGIFFCPIRSRYSQSRLEMVRWDLVPRGSSARSWKLSSRHFARLRLTAPGFPRMSSHWPVIAWKPSILILTLARPVFFFFFFFFFVFCGRGGGEIPPPPLLHNFARKRAMTMRLEG